MTAYLLVLRRSIVQPTAVALQVVIRQHRHRLVLFILDKVSLLIVFDSTMVLQAAANSVTLKALLLYIGCAVSAFQALDRVAEIGVVVNKLILTIIVAYH